MRFISLILLMSFTACSMLQEGKIDKPKLDLKSVGIERGDLQSATLLFGVEVDNPNPFPLKIDSVNYDVILDGKKVASQNIDSPTEVASASKSTINLPVTVNYREMFGSMSAMLSSKQTEYNISGTARLGLLSIPFDENGALSLKGGKVEHVSH